MSQPLEITVNDNNPTPPYEQIRRQLLAHIRSGALQEGARLAPVRQLAGDLGVAAGTVARAYRELESAGLVVTKRGGGTRVAEAAAELISHLLGDDSSALPTMGTLVHGPSEGIESGNGVMPAVQSIEVSGVAIDGSYVHLCSENESASERAQLTLPGGVVPWGVDPVQALASIFESLGFPEAKVQDIPAVSSEIQERDGMRHHVVRIAYRVENATQEGGSAIAPEPTQSGSWVPLIALQQQLIDGHQLDEYVPETVAGFIA